MDGDSQPSCFNSLNDANVSLMYESHILLVAKFAFFLIGLLLSDVNAVKVVYDMVGEIEIILLSFKLHVTSDGIVSNESGMLVI